MIEEVGRLRDQPLVALAARRQHDLRRLLADLLQDPLGPLREQACRVRRLGRGLRPLGHDTRQLLEHAGRGRRVLAEAGARARVTGRALRLDDAAAARRDRSRCGPRPRAGRCPRSRPSSRASCGCGSRRCAKPVSAVLARASAFAHATISTSPLARSCTITGRSPASFVTRPVGITTLIPAPPPAGARPLRSARPASGRTGTPIRSSSARASPIRISPKWKIEAARAALACPSVRASFMCATVPQPPEAITGTRTASATARVSAMS